MGRSEEVEKRRKKWKKPARGTPEWQGARASLMESGENQLGERRSGKGREHPPRRTKVFLRSKEEEK
jgi:hypothetical protein